MKMFKKINKTNVRYTMKISFKGAKTHKNIIKEINFNMRNKYDTQK